MTRPAAMTESLTHYTFQEPRLVDAAHRTWDLGTGGLRYRQATPNLQKKNQNLLLSGLYAMHPKTKKLKQNNTKQSDVKNQHRMHVA